MADVKQRLAATIVAARSRAGYRRVGTANAPGKVDQSTKFVGCGSYSRPGATEKQSRAFSSVKSALAFELRINPEKFAAFVLDFGQTAES
jgi:hypothetical protein